MYRLMWNVVWRISNPYLAKYERSLPEKKKKKEKIEGIKIAKNKKNADISHWNWLFVQIHTIDDIFQQKRKRKIKK